MLIPMIGKPIIGIFCEKDLTNTHEGYIIIIPERGMRRKTKRHKSV